MRTNPEDAMEHFVARKAMELECPTCGAPPQSFCETRKGGIRLPHSRRMEQAFRENVKVNHGADDKCSD